MTKHNNPTGEGNKHQPIRARVRKAYKALHYKCVGTTGTKETGVWLIILSKYQIDHPVISSPASSWPQLQTNNLKMCVSTQRKSQRQVHRHTSVKVPDKIGSTVVTISHQDHNNIAIFSRTMGGVSCCRQLTPLSAATQCGAPCIPMEAAQWRFEATLRVGASVDHAH